MIAIQFPDAAGGRGTRSIHQQLGYRRTGERTEFRAGGLFAVVGRGHLLQTMVFVFKELGVAQAAAKKSWQKRNLPNWRDRVEDLLSGHFGTALKLGAQTANSQ
jgi:hypothetical protein